ncbi:hypothetical protein Tco_1492848 [Tanacetum coccineum]
MSSMIISRDEHYNKYLTHQVPRGLVHFPVVANREPLSEDILGATTQRDTGSYYPKRYWELLPKEILGAITQRDTGSYYPKRDWDVLWENGALRPSLDPSRSELDSLSGDKFLRCDLQ